MHTPHSPALPTPSLPKACILKTHEKVPESPWCPASVPGRPPHGPAPCRATHPASFCMVIACPPDLPPGLSGSGLTPRPYFCSLHLSRLRGHTQLAVPRPQIADCGLGQLGPLRQEGSRSRSRATATAPPSREHRAFPRLYGHTQGAHPETLRVACHPRGGHELDEKGHWSHVLASSRASPTAPGAEGDVHTRAPPGPLGSCGLTRASSKHWVHKSSRWQVSGLSVCLTLYQVLATGRGWGSLLTSEKWLQIQETPWRPTTIGHRV